MYQKRTEIYNVSFMNTPNKLLESNGYHHRGWEDLDLEVEKRILSLCTYWEEVYRVAKMTTEHEVFKG